MKKLFGFFNRGISNLVEPKEWVQATEQADNIVFLLMKDFNAQEQNTILKTVVEQLKIKRKEQEQQKMDELTKLMEDNQILYSFNV